MTDEDLLDVAGGWSSWERDFPPTVHRRVRLPADLRPSLALVVQGVRRCGKSTLLRQMISAYQLDARCCLFVNFEDPRLVNALDATTLDRLVDGFRAARQGAERLVFFFDEIQGVDGWERWLRARLDRPGADCFVVTGSNAALLSGELGSVLTGRHLTVELFPFDLVERRLLHPCATLADHLRDGGFPEPLALQDGDLLRRQYVRDIVERDIRERLSARSSRPILQVLSMVYEAAGSELSARRVAGAAGLAIDTAGAYLDACEAAYLLFSVPFFAYSERKRAHRNRKFYPVDTALRRLVVQPSSDDRGKSLECATHLVLRRRYGQVFYWRGEGGEVDFVVQDGKRLVPVQVTWDGPLPRHERALTSFHEEFPFADEAVFVTADSFEAFDRAGGEL